MMREDMHTAAAPPGGRSVIGGATVDFGAHTFLVGETNAHARSLLSSALKAFGASRVRTADSGQQVLAIAQLEPPDLVVLDQALTPFDGFEVSKRLREHRGTGGTPIAIVMVGSDASADTVRAARTAGVDAFLVKPFSANDLHRRVSAVLLARLRAAAASAAAHGRQPSVGL